MDNNRLVKQIMQGTTTGTRSL